MPRLLIYVFGDTLIAGERYYEAAALISGTGMEDDKPSFAGALFALKDGEAIPLGDGTVAIGMMEQRPFFWSIYAHSLPDFPFFLSDDASQRVVLDRRIEVSPDSMLNRARMQVPVGTSAMNHPAVLCPITKSWLCVFSRTSRSEYRLIVIGRDATFPSTFELGDEEIPLGTARLLDDVD